MLSGLSISELFRTRVDLALLFSAWCVIAFPQDLSAQEPSAAISGTAYRVEKGSAHPLSNVEITLRSVEDQGLLGTTATDSAGAYRFDHVPLGTIRVTASRPGYLGAQAGVSPAAELVLSCPTPGSYPRNDLMLVRGASINGQVVDQYGEPAEGISVTAKRKDVEAADVSTGTETDDRGFFRIAGLPAGTYELAMQLRDTARGYEPQSKTVALSDGEEAEQVTLLLRHLTQFAVSGRLSGLSGGPGNVSLAVERLPRPGPRFPAETTTDGRFDFRLVPEGRYAVFSQRSGSVRTNAEDAFLNVIDVRNDMLDLLLSPAALGSVEGRVRPAGGQDLPAFQFALVSEDGLDTFRFRVDQPDFRFSLRDVKPGRYRIESGSPRFYVKRATPGSSSQESKVVDVREGAMTRVEMEAGTDFARVYGTVRSVREREPQPAGRVAMMGGGERRFAVADGQGRFEIPKIVPGEYRICAWERIPIDLIFEDPAWQEAGCMSRTFQVEPQADIELSLTAAKP